MSNELPGNSAPVDVNFLLEQVGGNADIAKMVIDEFVKQTPLDVENMAKLLNSGDLEAVGKVAHSLKGSSGTCGAAHLRECAAELEMACREGNASKAAEAFNTVNTEATRCMDFVPNLLAGL